MRKINKNFSFDKKKKEREAVKGYYSQNLKKMKALYEKNPCGETRGLYLKAAERHTAVENALRKLESIDPYLRKEYDKIFTYFYENDRRNVNAVSIECYVSPSGVYKRLKKLCGMVGRELEKLENTETVHLDFLWYASKI